MYYLGDKMPSYLIGVPYPEIDELMEEVLEWLRKRGKGGVVLDPLQIAIDTEKKLSEEELEEIRELLIKRYSELAKKMILLRKWE